jgi:hypothetical protein
VLVSPVASDLLLETNMGFKKGRLVAQSAQALLNPLR